MASALILTDGNFATYSSKRERVGKRLDVWGELLNLDKEFSKCQRLSRRMEK